MTDTLPVDPVAVARELWWPHHSTRRKDAALAELEDGGAGKCTMEFVDVVRIVESAMLSAVRAQERPAVRVKADYWIEVARSAGKNGIRFPTNDALQQFVTDVLSALEEAPPQPEQPAPASGDLVARLLTLGSLLTGQIDPFELETLGEAAAALEARDREIADIRAVLANPTAVHLNMMRGGIAKISWANVLHLYQEARDLETHLAALSSTGEAG